MGRGLTVSSVNVRPVNKVLRHKKARGNIHNSFRADHKPAEVKVKMDQLRQLKQQMYQQIFGGTEEKVAVAGTNINIVV